MVKEGQVIWITGLSGVGKTTLSNNLANNLRERGITTVNLDGDIVRSFISPELDFSESSRIKQINRIRNIARVLCEQNINVIVSALYSNPEILSSNRDYFTNYLEIYLNVSLEKLIERDSKGLYSKFLENKIKNVVGMDISWNPPKNPDLEFNNDVFLSCDKMSEEIIRGLK